MSLRPLFDQFGRDWSQRIAHLFKKFWHLIMYKVLRVDIRPWGSNQHFGPYGCKGCPSQKPHSSGGSKFINDVVFSALGLPYMALVHHAAQTGRVSFPSLMSNGLQHYIGHEQYHEETLMIAYRYGQSKVVNYLVQ